MYFRNGYQNVKHLEKLCATNKQNMRLWYLLVWA